MVRLAIDGNKMLNKLPDIADNGEQRYPRQQAGEAFCQTVRLRVHSPAWHRL
jgi:hypothetical protein